MKKVYIKIFNYMRFFVLTVFIFDVLWLEKSPYSAIYNNNFGFWDLNYWFLWLFFAVYGVFLNHKIHKITTKFMIKSPN